MELLVLLLTGGIAGWVAGALVRGAGYGLVINVVLGIVGGVIGGQLFHLLGIADHGWLVELGAAVIGAVILLAAVDALRRRAANP